MSPSKRDVGAAKQAEGVVVTDVPNKADVHQIEVGSACDGNGQCAGYARGPIRTDESDGGLPEGANRQTPKGLIGVEHFWFIPGRGSGDESPGFGAYPTSQELPKCVASDLL